MLIAVFNVCAYTSFETTLLHVSRSQTQWMMLAVMVVGLFMYAGIANAFGAGGLAFVVPLILIQVVRPIVTIVTAPTRMLREHYAIMLAWIVASTSLWIAGAMADEKTRLIWWVGAAVIDLIGTWLAHPVPGRVLHSENVGFDAIHMLERCRLFLIIALGESVLTTGAAIAEVPMSLMVLLTGTCALVTIIALWALYFGASDHLLNLIVASSLRTIRSSLAGR